MAAVKTFEKWQLGDKKVNNGLLVIVAPNERKMRIEVGYGLEGTITDLYSKRIIEEAFKPAFRDGRYADGILAGFDYMSKLMRKDPLPNVTPPPSANEAKFDGDLFLKLFLGVLLINLCVPTIYWIKSRTRKKTAKPYNNIGAAFMLFAFFGVFFGLFAGVFGMASGGMLLPFLGVAAGNLLFGLVFFFAMIRGRPLSSSSYRSASNDSNSWSSSSSSSWSSSSDSSSSSSGGGSSGGGGASGSY